MASVARTNPTSDPPPPTSAQRPPALARCLPRPHDPGDDPGQQPRLVGRDQYWPLDHAEWHGWTPTDLIFPFFLFIVGTSLAYSLRKYRDGAQIELGRLLADRPPHGAADFPGLAAWRCCFASIGYFSGDDALRLEQRFAYSACWCGSRSCTFVTSLIVLHIPLRGQVVLASSCCLGYWALLALAAQSARLRRQTSRTTAMWSASSIARCIGDNHMYRGEPATPIPKVC